MNDRGEAYAGTVVRWLAKTKADGPLPAPSKELVTVFRDRHAEWLRAEAARLDAWRDRLRSAGA